MLYYYEYIRNCFLKYYYLNYHNNNDNYSRDNVELPVLTRETATADLALLMV